MEELYIVVDKMRDILDSEYLLDSIVQLMSYDELKSRLEFIARNEDLPLLEDERVECV